MSPGVPGRGYLVAGILLAGASLLASFFPQPTRAAVGDSAQLAAGILAAFACAAAARRHAGRSRAAWAAFALGAAAWAAGQLLWTWEEVVAGQTVAIPGPADVGYLALPIFGLAGVLLLSAAAGTRRAHETIGAMLDNALVSGSLLLVVWAFLLRDVVAGASDPRAVAMAVAYPIADIILIGQCLGFWMRSGESHAFAGLLAFLGFFLAADVGLAVGIFSDAYATGQMADAGWILGFTALGVTATAYVRAPAVPPAPTFLPRAIPLGALFVAASVPVISTMVRPRSFDLLTEVLLVGLVLVAGARQAILVRAQASLAESRQQALDELRRSETRLAEAQKIAHLGTWELDVASGALWWSDECHRIFGIEPGSTTPSYAMFLAHIHPEDRARVEAAYRAHVERRQPYDIEHRIVTAQGKERFVHERCETELDRHGEPLVSRGTIVDITERKQAEASIQFQAHLLGMVGEAVVATDLEGLITFWNAAAERLYGYTRSEAVGQPITLIVDALQGEPAGESLGEAGVQRRGDQRVRRKDGTSFVARFATSPLLDADARLVGFIGVSTDVTAEREAARAVRESEARLREAQRTARIGSWEVGIPSGRHYWSEAMFEILAHPLDAPLPDVPASLEFVAAEDRASVAEAFERLLADGTPMELDARLARRDGHGEPLWVSVRGFADRDPQGKVVGAHGTLQDVTQRRRAEASLRRSEATLQDAQRLAHMGSFETDAQTGEVAWSSELYRILGRAPTQTAVPVSAVLAPFAPDMARILAEDERKALAEGASATRDLERRTNDGSEWLSVSVAPRIEDGRVKGTKGVVQVITERKRSEDALRRNDRLSMLGTLVAGVAHEINNPLTYIRGNLEFIQEAARDRLARATVDEERKAIQTMVDDAATAIRGLDRIAAITRGLRQVARPTGGVRTLERPDEVVVGILPVARPRLPPNVEVRLDLASESRVACNVDEISQILLNLLFNAADAMREKGGEIRIGTRDDGDRVVIEIEDHGVGMSPEVQARVFHPFFTTKASGTGLGLSISRSIAEAHGGSLTFDSKEYEGTTFRLVLPVQREGEPTP